MAGPSGIASYSPTPATNATASGGNSNWAENQPASSVNNSVRQDHADLRIAFNDLIWFSYGSGDQAPGVTFLGVPYIYTSATTVTVAGVDVTIPHHIGRRMKFVGAITGTIYGRITASAFGGGNTTITLAWDAGSLSNEVLTGYLSQVPVTGSPIPTGAIGTGALTVTSDSASALAVGANGVVNPVLQVDASLASVVSGIKITGGVINGNTSLAAIGSGVSSNLFIDAFGTGSINIGATSTGNIVLNRHLLVGTTTDVAIISATGATAGAYVIKASSGSTGFTLLADNQSATESILNCGVLYSNANVFLASGLKANGSGAGYLSSYAASSIARAAIELELTTGNIVFKSAASTATSVGLTITPTEIARFTLTGLAIRQISHNSTTDLTLLGYNAGIDEDTASVYIGDITGTTKQVLFAGINQANSYSYIGAVSSHVQYTNFAINPNGGTVTVGSATSPSGGYFYVKYNALAYGMYASCQYAAWTNSIIVGECSVAAPNNTASRFLLFNDNVQQRGTWYSNGGIGNFSANNSNFSDATMKSQIELLRGTPVIDRLWAAHKSIDWNRHKFNDQSHDDWNYGYTAQGIAKAFADVAPELVDEEDIAPISKDLVEPHTPRMVKTVYHHDITNIGGAILTEAQHRIEALEARIAQLERTIH